MYDFIDVTEKQTKNYLPAEALQIDGQYIENVISGYRTLHVEGRELLPSEVIMDDESMQNGANFRGKRYPVRSIRVTFQLILENIYDFRKAFNILNGILNFENAKLIFNDEPDMYFIGTSSEVGDIEPGLNSVIGEFEIICTDPFKYSLEDSLLKIPYGKKKVEIDYQGSHNSYPSIQIDILSDTGYVAFYNEHGGIIQIGDPDEVDKAPGTKTDTLINYLFTQNNYKASDWIKDKAFLVHDQMQGGNVGIKTGGNLQATSYGNNNGGWHGPSLTMELPKDSSGHTGTKNWTIESSCLTSILNTNEMGSMGILVTGRNSLGERVNLAGIMLMKNKEGYRSQIELYVAGKPLRTLETTFYENMNNLKDYPYYNYRISKFGKKMEFHCPEGRYEFDVPDIENIEAAEVSLIMAAFQNWKIAKMEFKNLRFRSHEVECWEDIPNKFTKGDKIDIDCETGEIRLNGVLSPELGAIGNTWDKFYLKHGLNSLAYDFSEWAQCPDVSIRYRMVMI